MTIYILILINKENIYLLICNNCFSKHCFLKECVFFILINLYINDLKYLHRESILEHFTLINTKTLIYKSNSSL